MAELHAALLQGAVTLGTAIVCWALYRRYRRPDILWWSVAWTLYVLRIGAIVVFLWTREQRWLFIHQILTGWTALALLWAAMTFSGMARPQRWYVLAWGFPLIWSYLAIFQLQSFMLAAVPAVLFLSFATLWTGWIFVRQWRATRSSGAAVLATVLLAWGLHHLDYPILRARGAWNPWGYYLDIMFVLAMAIGIVLLILEALESRRQDLQRLSTLMIRQHEDERRRLSLELHDQSAQVWAAVKMQLGLLRERAPTDLTPSIDRVLTLADAGIRSIRSVTTNLRPPLLDDLGLVPALRALAHDFADQTGLAITFHADELPPISSEASLVLFRALQEALANVARHSGGTSAEVTVRAAEGTIQLRVVDNGRGPGMDGPQAQRPTYALGLTGMQERIVAIAGSMDLRPGAAQGASLTVTIPSQA